MAWVEGNHGCHHAGTAEKRILKRLVRCGHEKPSNERLAWCSFRRSIIFWTETARLRADVNDNASASRISLVMTRQTASQKVRVPRAGLACGCRGWNLSCSLG